MKLVKKTLFALYALVIVCIGLATVIEKYRGTDYVADYIYGAWWFSALWAVLTVVACAYMVDQHLYKRAAVMLLHFSFVVILAGALVTHLFARQGKVSLRTGITETNYVDKDGRVEHLPFSLTLKEFRIVNYPGTDAPLDYQSIVEYSVHGSARSSAQPTTSDELIVSMNHIGNINGYRLFQSSYDSDGKGVTLGMNHDPYGIAITYIGYLLLLLGIIATLLSRKTQIRGLYKKAMLSLLLMVCASAHANESLSAVDEPIARRIGTINVLYNNRICPLNTVATDFTTKLTGSATWKGYSADEIFTSWMIYYSPWERQKLIRIKSREVQHLLGISDQWASYSDFLNEFHEYKLKEVVEAVKTGKSTSASVPKKALMEADEKFHLIEMFYSGQLIRMFPFRQHATVNWYMPGSQSLPREIPVKEQFFIKQAMDYLTESIVTGQRERAFEIIAKIKLFQRDMIGDLLPTDGTTQAEIFYNTLRSQKWPVFLALTVSLLVCIVMLLSSKQSAAFRFTLCAIHLLLFSYVSLQLALRWWLSGHIPVSNGPETMLFMAWTILLLSALLHRRFPIITVFSPLIVSFCLLVAMLGGSSSQITPLMPVLQSPLLSLHVMSVMCAYALFALQVLLGIHAFILIWKTRKGEHPAHSAQLAHTTALSQLLLYPAVFLLAIGIFLGAVWANVSWGTYWSWDPKEAWALITFMVYAVPLHSTSLPVFRRPVAYHLYITLAFLTILMTYFGVNYILGGMHSYA